MSAARNPLAGAAAGAATGAEQSASGTRPRTRAAAAGRRRRAPALLAVAVAVALLLAAAVVGLASEAPLAALAKRRSYGSDEKHEESGGGKGASKGSGGGDEDKGEDDSELLDKMLRESEVLQLIDREQKQHERRLNELHQRLERELIAVQTHFESVMAKLKATEAQLESNLKNVERAIANKVEESKKTVKASNDSWRFPFFILVVLILGVAGFFGSLYRKATKHARML